MLADGHARNDVFAAALDQDADDFGSVLASLDPVIVVHTAGP